MKTLIVEDASVMRQLLESILRERGHEVTACADAESAWKVYQRNSYPLVLLDLILPGMDGLHLCRQMRKLPHGNHSVILVITACNQPADLQAVLEAGADDYLAKPVDMQRLNVRLAIAEKQARDRTEHRKAEGALHESEAKNRAILHAIPDLMFRIGKDGTYLDFKATSDKDLYVLPNQFLGKKIDEVMPPALAQQTMDYVEQALKTGELQIFEYQLLVSGNNRDYEGRIAVSGEDEVLAIVREVTDRKRAEKQLLTSKDAAEQANHSKSIFLADMSHELRTPLNAIIGYSEMLIEEAEDLGEPDSIPDLQRIQTAGNHLLTLINDILDISKIEAGKMELYPETFDVSYVIQEVVGRLFQFPQQGESPLRV